MGYPMAGHLKRAGHDVTVYNRTRGQGRRTGSAEYGGTAAATPAEAAARRRYRVLACVGRDADLREVTLGEDGAFAAMKKGAVFVDHTTASATHRARTGRRRREKARLRLSSMRRFPAARRAR